MTGDAFGKILIPNSIITLCDKNNDCFDLDDIKIYVHIKGFAEAKITHIDIEGGDSGRIEEEFLGKGDRISVKLYYDSDNGYLYVSNPNANMMIYLNIPIDEDIICYGVLGIKEEGGIFIGLCRKLLEKFEEWGMERLEASDMGVSD